MIDLDRFNAPAKTALMVELRRRDDFHMPELTDAEARAIADEVNRKHTYGFDYKTDRNGEPIEQGIGARSHETTNHFMSILRYEGQAAYDKAVRELDKRDRPRRIALGLPEPQRLGA